MSMFWLAAILMVAVFVLFLVLPLLRVSSKGHQDAFILSNTRLIKQRLAELEDEFNQGLISDKHKEQAQKELKLALLEEQYTQAEHSRKHKTLYLAVLVVALVVCGGLYWQVTELPKVQKLSSIQERIQPLTDKIIVGNGEEVTPQDLFDFALAIRSRISDNPDDATGWMLLGRIYSSLEQYEQSFAAFDKALALQPNSVETLSSYAQALMIPNQVSYLRQAVTILQRWLSLEPSNNNAALMLSMTASQLDDLAMTKTYFAKIEGLLPEDNPAIIQLRNKIAELERLEASGEADLVTGFSVNITATELILGSLEAENQLNPTTLFVFARAANSTNKMPVAVKKLPLNKLPLKVALTQTDAMLASYTLSSVSEVDLVVRLSFDEVVQSKIGEYEGSITVPVVAGQIIEHTVIVDKEIK
jgi:cytochrome c-type biogenesis protein CcmI